MNYIRHIFTGRDNLTPDIGRILWALGVLVFLAQAVGALWFQHQPWDPSAYGLGLGAVLAGGGAGIGLKARTEPGGN